MMCSPLKPFAARRIPLEAGIVLVMPTFESGDAEIHYIERGTGFPILLFWPIDIRTTRFDVVWIGASYEGDERPSMWTPFIELFDSVLKEDTQFLSGIQSSVESPAFTGIPLSYQERRIYHVHEEIDRVIGPERIPDHLRVEPLLGPYVEKTQA